MVVLNYTGEEINAKIVYYGPALSGKTTNLEQLYGQMPADAKGQMVSMKTRTDRTLFFDFFPLELGEISGYRTRFLLYTVPGQVYYNATRKLVLKGADAVVFVADSAPDKMQDNIDSLRNLEDNLNENGLSLDNIPWVIQYNKRDVPGAIPVEELHQQLNLMNVPALEAVAVNGFGVYDSFRCIAGALYKSLKERLESGERIVRSTGDEDGAQMPGTHLVGREEDVTDAVDSALREVGGESVSLEPKTTPTDPVQAPHEVGQPDLNRIRPRFPQSAPVEPRNGEPGFLSAEAQVSADVGRLVELDESSETDQPGNHTPSEFITDPMQRTEPPVVAAPPELGPEIEPEGEAVVKERKVEPEDEEITIPVVISRSQVRKTVPLKLRLEIRVIDD